MPDDRRSVWSQLSVLNDLTVERCSQARAYVLGIVVSSPRHPVTLSHRREITGQKPARRGMNLWLLGLALLGLAIAKLYTVLSEMHRRMQISPFGIEG